MRALLCASLLLGACRSRVPTYHRDIAPLVEKHCRDCHRPEGIAPVPLLNDYANVRIYAQPIRFAVQTRRMPPWGADNTGLCGSWQGARWLSSDEIDIFARWESNGAPEGDPEDHSPEPARAEKFRADAVLEAGGVYRPGLGAGGYRCFLADPKLAADRLLSAIRVVADDPRGVAQVTLFALDSPAAESAAAALDAADATAGYSCYGTTRVSDSRLVASWSWPDPILRLPTSTGVRLHGGRKMVVQIHYNLAQPGGGYQTATRVELQLDDHLSEARVLPIVASGVLAEGKKYVAVENRQRIERRQRVVGVVPRMHIRGDTLQLTVEHGSSSTCLGNFDHWHFDKEQLFRPDKPLLLEAGDRVHISCAYATVGRSAPVQFGDGIDDEECVAYLFVTDN